MLCSCSLFNLVLSGRSEINLFSFVLLSSKMPFRSENVDKIISAHPQGTKINVAPRAIIRINTVFIRFRRMRAIS